MSRPGTPEREFRSRCPIATTLDIVGDRWTLLILRDLILGKQRFSEFLEAPEGITTSVLTDRLARIEAAGLATRKPYQTRPTRYEYRVTKKGRDLAPVLEAISKWANRYYPGTGRVSKQITAR